MESVFCICLINYFSIRESRGSPKTSGGRVDLKMHAQCTVRLSCVLDTVTFSCAACAQIRGYVLAVGSETISHKYSQ